MVHNPGGLAIALVLVTCVVHHGGVALRHDYPASHTNNLEDEVPWSLKSENPNRLWQKHVQMGRRVVAQQRDERFTLSQRLNSNELRKRSITNRRNRNDDSQMQSRHLENRIATRQLYRRSEFPDNFRETQNYQNLQRNGNRRSKAMLDSGRDSVSQLKNRRSKAMLDNGRETVSQLKNRRIAQKQLDSMKVSQSHRDNRLSGELNVQNTMAPNYPLLSSSRLNTRRYSNNRQESGTQFIGRRVSDTQQSSRQTSADSYIDKRTSNSRLDRRQESELRQNTRKEKSRLDIRRASELRKDKQDVSKLEVSLRNTVDSHSEIRRKSIPRADTRRLDETQVNNQQKQYKNSFDSSQTSLHQLNNRRQLNSLADMRLRLSSRADKRRNVKTILNTSTMSDSHRETTQNFAQNDIERISNLHKDKSQHLASRVNSRRTDSRKLSESRIDTVRLELQQENKQSRRVDEVKLQNRRQLVSRVNYRMINNRHESSPTLNNRIILNSRQEIRQEPASISDIRKTDETQNDNRRTLRVISRKVDNRQVSNFKFREIRKEFETPMNYRRTSEMQAAVSYRENYRRVENKHNTEQKISTKRVSDSEEEYRQEVRTQRDIRRLDKTRKDNRKHTLSTVNKENIETRQAIDTRRISDSQPERRQEYSYRRQISRVGKIYSVDSTKNSNRRVSGTGLEMTLNSQQEKSRKSATQRNPRSADPTNVDNLRNTQVNSRSINSRQKSELGLDTRRNLYYQRDSRRESCTLKNTRGVSEICNDNGKHLIPNSDSRRIKQNPKTESTIYTRRILDSQRNTRREYVPQRDIRRNSEINANTKQPFESQNNYESAINSQYNLSQGSETRLTRQNMPDSQFNNRIISEARTNKREVNEIRHRSNTRRDTRRISDSHRESRQIFVNMDTRRTEDANIENKRVIQLKTDTRRKINSHSRRELLHQLPNENNQLQDDNMYNENLINKQSIQDHDSFKSVMQEASFVIPTTFKTSKTYFSFIGDTVQKAFHWNNFFPLPGSNSHSTKHQQNKSVGETIISGVWTSLAGLALYHAVRPGKDFLECY